MGTTADKLAYLENTKSAIREALAKYGRGPDEAAPFRAYAGLIDGMGRSLADSSQPTRWRSWRRSRLCPRRRSMRGWCSRAGA